ncbi:phage tail assembly chaperone [Photorhabdus sp. RM323S]|uniref:phage tail assembly chaperone n=1 Tax=Photorhabdus sp. RM323S TaxID=3342828 RepID=UPI0036DF522A
MEFEINGIQYRTAKLSVFDQLKVSRKLLPVLAGLVSDIRAVQTMAQDRNMEGALEKALPKIAQAVSDLSDEDCNAILYPCLSVVSRQHGKGWTAVFSQGVLHFDDIDLPTLLQLVARVIGDSLGNFLHALPAQETPFPPAA